jgi:hypothetical protein
MEHQPDRAARRPFAGLEKVTFAKFAGVRGKRLPVLTAIEIMLQCGAHQPGIILEIAAAGANAQVQLEPQLFARR